MHLASTTSCGHSVIIHSVKQHFPGVYLEPAHWSFHWDSPSSHKHSSKLNVKERCSCSSVKLNHAREVSWGQWLSKLWNYFKRLQDRLSFSVWKWVWKPQIKAPSWQETDPCLFFLLLTSHSTILQTGFYFALFSSSFLGVPFWWFIWIVDAS